MMAGFPQTADAMTATESEQKQEPSPAVPNLVSTATDLAQPPGVEVAATSAPASAKPGGSWRWQQESPESTSRRHGRGPRQEGAQTPKAAPMGGPRAARAIPPVLEQLAELYPGLFGEVFLPLKRGIFQELLAAHPGVLDREALKTGLAIHTRSTRYLQAVAAGLQRHDLAGQAVEAMAPEHVHQALLEVFRRRQSRAGEDLRPKLLQRLIQAFEASGLTREAYDERVRGRDDAANALLDEALADGGPARQGRSAVARVRERGADDRGFCRHVRHGSARGVPDAGAGPPAAGSRNVLTG
jgi:sRNA-binding protein